MPDRFDNASLDANGNGQVSKEEFYAVVGTQNPAAAGENGCFYFNPFGSSFPNNKNLGQPNPRYVPGAENSAELSARLYDDRQLEEQSQNLTIDALVSGGSPFNLPGGEIAWAAGAQWRQSGERKSTTGPFLDEDKFPRSWPGQQVGNVGCPSQESPYFFFNTENFDPTDQQQCSYFGDLQVPVLENLSLQLAVRREEFPQPDLSPTVYKIAGKWEPLAWLAIRGSHGTNYATPPANLTPGDLEAALALVASAGNKFQRVETETLPGVKPETAKVANLGVIFTFDNRMPMDGALRINLDYFDFRIEDEIKTVSHNAILNSTFLDPARLGRNELINCNASLIERITFINGKGSAGCAQGVTTGDSVTGIRSVYGNGPGIKTSGIDTDVMYALRAFGGDMTAAFNGTNILSYEIDAFRLNGAVLTQAVDGKGFANYSRDGDLVSEWRANATLNYALGNHNLRYQLRNIQGVEDDRELLNSPRRQIDDFITHNLYYHYALPWDENFQLSVSIENVTDEDPPFTQQQYSYDPAFANALGRTYEVGLRKQF